MVNISKIVPLFITQIVNIPRKVYKVRNYKRQMCKHVLSLYLGFKASHIEMPQFFIRLQDIPNICHVLDADGNACVVFENKIFSEF